MLSHLQESGALKSVSSALVCGTTYSKDVNGGLCPATGTVTIAAPTAPGQYRVALARYRPPNEFGQDG
jgi:hypothetical protein